MEFDTDQIHHITVDNECLLDQQIDTLVRLIRDLILTQKHDEKINYEDFIIAEKPNQQKPTGMFY